MAEAFVETFCEGVNFVTDKHFDKVYDAVAPRLSKLRPGRSSNPESPRTQRAQPQQQQEQQQQNDENYPASANSGRRRRQTNRLPSPEGDGQDDYYNKRSSRRSTADYDKSRRRESVRSASLDRESETSARVIRDYANERDDPPRKAETVLSKRDLRKLNSRDRDAAIAGGAVGAGATAAGMSYANGGYGGGGLSAPAYDRRANSQQPPRSRYDDEDSDYDERSGRRYKSSGKGYDDGYDDRGYDREIVETERYRGPARDFDSRRQSYGNRGDPYGEGAVTTYRRSNQEVDDYKSQRSRSRGRRYSERERDRSGSYSRSRSRSRSRSHEGIRGKIDETFDTSMKGLGVGIAGAVIGGLAGKEFGGHKHQQRDMILGALVGGLGANAAENKWRDWRHDKERKLERDEDRIEQRWDGGRSRSAMR